MKLQAATNEQDYSVGTVSTFGMEDDDFEVFIIGMDERIINELWLLWKQKRW